MAAAKLNGRRGGSDYTGESGNGNGRPRELRAYKYTTQEKGLAEEIFLESENKTKFLLLDPDTGEPILLDQLKLIHEMFAIIKPHEINASNPNQSLIKPYSYESEEEIRQLIRFVRQLDISDLFSLVEYVWRNVVVTKEKELIILLTNYTLLSYFQDLFETIHYIMLNGPPGWGKGAILVTFKLLGYRVVMAGDMSGANLLDLIGLLEPCQVSLAEDELDRLDEDTKKQSIYKIGYEDSAVIPRTVDAGSSNRSLNTYSPFGCKLFASEKPPDSKVLGGFNDRTFREDVKKGKPALSIKRIKKQMERPVHKQAPKYRLIIERINFLHKILLIYRLVHHTDDLTTNELPLNIYGRPLELCGPSIQLYHTLNNKRDEDPDKYKIRNKVMNTLSHFLRKKGELDKKTIEGILYKILDDVFNKMEADNIDVCQFTKMEERTDLQGVTTTYFIISYEGICDEFKNEVEGVGISAKTFECADFGKVTHDHLISRCKNVFGGIPVSIGRDKEKKKALEFDKAAVKEAGNSFEIVSEIKILEQEEVFEDTAEDKELWSLIDQRQKSGD